MRYEFEKLKERLITGVVWALPAKIVYWAAIRVLSYATTCEHHRFEGNVPDLTGMEALKCWEKNHA